jgi:hypothetical protein
MPQAVPLATAFAAPADGSVQTPHIVHCGAQADGDDDAAAEASPPGTSGSVPSQAFAGPQQPRFTLGVPGDATPTAKRRQLPPAAQVCFPATEHLQLLLQLHHALRTTFYRLSALAVFPTF